MRLKIACLRKPKCNNSKECFAKSHLYIDNYKNLMRLFMAFVLVSFDDRALIRNNVLDCLAIPFRKEVFGRVFAHFLAHIFLYFVPRPIVVHRMAGDIDRVPHAPICVCPGSRSSFGRALGVLPVDRCTCLMGIAQAGYP